MVNKPSPPKKARITDGFQSQKRRAPGGAPATFSSIEDRSFIENKIQPNFEVLPIPQLLIARALNRLEKRPRQSWG
jgi:hypothetical protein